MNERRLQNEVYHYDVMMYHDDWGTAKAPFFSVDLFKETLLPPTIRIFKAVREAGAIPFHHCCGLIDAFVPFMAGEIGVDAIEIQAINDVRHIVQTYGDRLTVEYTRPDPYFFYDPDTTAEMVQAKARDIVDVYGAQANPGAGVLIAIIARDEELYYAFHDELYRYSLEKYAAA